MRIYRYWHFRNEEIDGVMVRFKAGSNESPEAAEELLREKIAVFKQYDGSAEPDEKLAEALRKKLWEGCGDEYEAPICEEITEELDACNIITRNRYGALVLNSEDHAFLDIDFDGYLPSEGGFKRKFLELFGLVSRPPKEERFETYIRRIILEKYPYTSFRLYRTPNGFRLLTQAKGEANSAKMAEMMRIFCCDELYTTLCAKQNCFRARLTPKPRRIRMRTALKFSWPALDEEAQERQEWLEEYARKSAKFRSCLLLDTFGSELNTPIVRKHDEMCRCFEDLPLA